jgi:transcription antitermination factor NusG
MISVSTMFHNVTDRTDTMSERQEAGQGLWCVLRTGGARTIPLARSLAQAGLGAWTPSKTIKRIRPRSRIEQVIEAPIMPTFVFVPAANRFDLQAILRLPSSPHPQFSFFWCGNRSPLISDEEVDRLRLYEMRIRGETRRVERPAVNVGAPVRVTEGAFAGMSGVIVGENGRRGIVDFGGNFPVEIDAWQLRTLEIEAA